MKRPLLFGFTLIELLIVLLLLVILVVMAAPSFVDTLDRRRVINATQTLTGQIQQARSVAVTRNRTVSLVIKAENPGEWCFGLTDSDGTPPDCDCTLDEADEDETACTVQLPAFDPSAPVDRVLVRADQTGFPGVTLSLPDGSPMVLSFEPTRGVRVGGAVTVSAQFASPRGLQTRVDVSPLGRISTCSPSGANLLGGLGACESVAEPPEEEV